MNNDNDSLEQPSPLKVVPSFTTDSTAPGTEMYFQGLRDDVLLEGAILNYPFPWSVEKQENGYGFHIKDANGKAIVQVWRQAVANIILAAINKELP